MNESQGIQQAQLPRHSLGEENQSKYQPWRQLSLGHEMETWNMARQNENDNSVYRIPHYKNSDQRPKPSQPRPEPRPDVLGS